MQVLRRSSELQAVAFGERALGLASHRHTCKSVRIVSLVIAVLAFDGESVLSPVHSFNAGIFAWVDPSTLLPRV